MAEDKDDKGLLLDRIAEKDEGIPMSVLNKSTLVQDIDDHHSSSGSFFSNYYLREICPSLPSGRTLWEEVKNNAKSGFTVSLVSVPLSISLSVAARGTPLMGVLTAAWAGLFAAFFGSSDYNIVGPTGALSGLLAQYAQTYGIGMLPYLAIISGILTLAIYALKWQRYIMFIPSSVIHGFTIGVAFIIGLNQLNSAFGLKGLTPYETFRENVWESAKHLDQTEPVTLVVFLVNTVALLMLIRKWPRAPWAVLIAVLGIVIGMMGSQDWMPLKLQTLQSKYGDLDPGYMVQFPTDFSTKMISVDLIQGGAAICFIAILETLISAKIADGMTKTRHHPRREVLGLAIANVMSGLCGGIPATAALARTALNIRSGASSRISAVINSLMVFIISLALLRFFKYLPMPVIAAILVVVAIRMVEIDHMKHLWKVDRKMFGLSMVVACLVVISDPTTGILFGTVVALLMFSDALSHGHSDVTITKGMRIVSHVNLSELDKAPRRQSLNSSSSGGGGGGGVDMPSSPSESSLVDIEEFGNTLVYKFQGELTYINSLAHEERLSKLNYAHTILNLHNLYYIDLDGLDAMQEMIEDLERRGSEVSVSGVQDSTRGLLEKVPWYHEKMLEGLVFETTQGALQHVDEDAGKASSAVHPLDSDDDL